MIQDENVTSFEASLASLRPRGANLDRDRLMFLAGQASVVYWPSYRPRVFRPAATSAIVAAMVTFLAVTATESGSRIADAIASTAASTATVAHERPAAHKGNALEYRVEVGNSLGWVVSLLVGQPAEAEPRRAEQSMVQLRESLLNESEGLGRADATDDGPRRTEATRQTPGEGSQAELEIPEKNS